VSAPAAAPLFADVVPFRLAALAAAAPQVFTSEGRVRHLLRQRTRNGLAQHLLWVGRQPFVTLEGLRAWLTTRTEKDGGRS
jgi:hypothetical protein